MQQLGQEWIGSVSWGTMREEDLIPSFLSVLASAKHPKAGQWEREYDRWYKRLHVGEEDGYQTTKFSEEECREQIGYLLHEDIWPAMDSIAPDSTYFGASEGDGADYGFWPVEQEEEDSEEEDS